MCVTDEPKSGIIGFLHSQFFWEVFNSVAENRVGLNFGRGAFFSLGIQRLWFEREGSFLHCKGEAVIPLSIHLHIWIWVWYG